MTNSSPSHKQGETKTQNSSVDSIAAASTSYRQMKNETTLHGKVKSNKMKNETTLDDIFDKLKLLPGIKCIIFFLMRKCRDLLQISQSHPLSLGLQITTKFTFLQPLNSPKNSPPSQPNSTTCKPQCRDTMKSSFLFWLPPPLNHTRFGPLASSLSSLERLPPPNNLPHPHP